MLLKPCKSYKYFYKHKTSVNSVVEGNVWISANKGGISKIRTRRPRTTPLYFIITKRATYSHSYGLSSFN